MLKDLAKMNRSYRRFYEDAEVTLQDLADLVDTARYVASGANRQPIRYKLVADKGDCA